MFCPVSLPHIRDASYRLEHKQAYQTCAVLLDVVSNISDCDSLELKTILITLQTRKLAPLSGECTYGDGVVVS